jgi:hypothetical protein
MSGQKLIGFPQHPPDSPELEYLLRGCADETERNVVRHAFHTFALGDPGGFSIQFAALLQAHARALKSAPERLRKAVATEFAAISDSLAAHRSSLKDAETAISKNAEGIHEQVMSFSEETQELRTVISQMREAEDAARATLLTRVSEETKTIQGAAESILDISTKRILIAIAAAYLMGVASYPVISAQFSWVWKLL